MKPYGWPPLCAQVPPPRHLCAAAVCRAFYILLSGRGCRAPFPTPPATRAVAAPRAPCTWGPGGSRQNRLCLAAWCPKEELGSIQIDRTRLTVLLATRIHFGDHTWAHLSTSSSSTTTSIKKTYCVLQKRKKRKTNLHDDEFPVPRTLEGSVFRCPRTLQGFVFRFPDPLRFCMPVPRTLQGFVFRFPDPL